MLAEGSSVPEMQSLQIHRHSQNVYTEVILHWLQSPLLLPLLASSPLPKVKTLVKNNLQYKNEELSNLLYPVCAHCCFSPCLFLAYLRVGAGWRDRILHAFSLSCCFHHDIYTGCISLIGLSDFFPIYNGWLCVAVFSRSRESVLRHLLWFFPGLQSLHLRALRTPTHYC